MLFKEIPSLLSEFGVGWGLGESRIFMNQLPDDICCWSLDYVLCSKIVVNSESQWLDTNSAEFSVLYF